MTDIFKKNKDKIYKPLDNFLTELEKTEVDMSTYDHTFPGVQEFVEKYYPDYFNCDTIAMEEDLTRIVTEEDETEHTYDILRDEYRGNRDAAANTLQHIRAEIFEIAIHEFQQQNNFPDMDKALKQLKHLLEENAETNRNSEIDYSVPELEKLYEHLKQQNHA